MEDVISTREADGREQQAWTDRMEKRSSQPGRCLVAFRQSRCRSLVSGSVSCLKIFQRHREHQEAFVRERMDRLLSGRVTGVIKGLRRMATDRCLRADKRKTIDRVCSCFEHNASRMQYDEYLRQGYPIATRVIEGAPDFQHDNPAPAQIHQPPSRHRADGLTAAVRLPQKRQKSGS